MLEKIIGYKIKQQIEDTFPSLMLSLFMGAVVMYMSYIFSNTLASLLIQIFMGAVIYIGASHILKLEPYKYIYKIVIDKMKKTHNQHL